MSTKDKITKGKKSNRVEQNIKPIILVDSSYTSFYRFFATIRWYSFSHPEEFAKVKQGNKYDWSSNPIFMEKYEKMYLDSIIKLIKKKIFDDSIVIFCLDSPREKLWRTKIQCDYKGDRPDLTLKHNFKPVFNYTYNTMIPQFIKSNPETIYSLRVEKMEADDLIAIIAMYQEKTCVSRPVYLVSGDEDFLQLGRDNLTFINYKAKKPIVLTKEQAALALREKIITGDTSDCIPSIFPKGKRVKKKEILESDSALNEYLQANPEAKTQYEINKQMIDFNNIPKKYIEKVEAKYITLFKN